MGSCITPSTLHLKDILPSTHQLSRESEQPSPWCSVSIQHDGVHHRAAEIQPDFGIIPPVYSQEEKATLPRGNEPVTLSRAAFIAAKTDSPLVSTLADADNTHPFPCRSFGAFTAAVTVCVNSKSRLLTDSRCRSSENTLPGE